jgi:ABC-2 type transport system permease protein
MTTLTDSVTMLRLNLRHTMRNPFATVGAIGVPIVFLLLFNYVLGGTLRAGLGGLSHGSGAYLGYLVPGLVILCVSAGIGGTALSISYDKSQGIITRFRTMPITRTSVLTGQVYGAVIRTVVSVAVVIGFAVLLGFRPNASPVEWLAMFGVTAALALGTAWFAVPFGLITKTPEGANSATLLLQFLPFLGSAFVRPESMPAGVRWFAENQPFTPAIETVRGLLTGTPIGNRAVVTLVWCVGLTVVGYLWSRRVFLRQR